MTQATAGGRPEGPRLAAAGAWNQVRAFAGSGQKAYAVAGGQHRGPGDEVEAANPADSPAN
jgi:hypothetical protein